MKIIETFNTTIAELLSKALEASNPNAAAQLFAEGGAILTSPSDAALLFPEAAQKIGNRAPLDNLVANIASVTNPGVGRDFGIEAANMLTAPELAATDVGAKPQELVS